MYLREEGRGVMKCVASNRLVTQVNPGYHKRAHEVQEEELAEEAGDQISNAMRMAT